MELSRASTNSTVTSSSIDTDKKQLTTASFNESLAPTTPTITMKNTDSNERDAAPTLTPLHSSLATKSREEVTTWPFPPLASVALPDASVALLDTGFESSRAHSEQSLSSSRSVITDTDTDSSLSDTFVLSDGFGLSDGLSGGFVGNTELPPATSNVFSTLPSDSDLVNRATTPRSIGEGVTATVASSSSSASTAVGLKAARGELGREVGASYRDWGVASDISILSTLTPAPTTPPAHLPHTYITTTSSTSPVSTVGDTPTTTLTALPFEATPTLSSATVQPIPILSSASLFQPTTPILPSASDQPTTPLLPSASLFQPTPIRTSRTFVPTLTLQATYVVSHPALSPLPTPATTPLSDSERVGSVVVASVDANVKTRTGTQTPSALVDEGRSTSVAVSGGDVHATTVSTAEGVEGGLPAVTATHQHTSTTLTNLSGASDMASAGVTDSLQPVNGTAGDTTITNPPSTPSSPSPAPPLTPSAALHTPATAISSRVVTDNSATLISASFDYLPLDSGTTSLVGSSVSGGEEASFSLLSSAGVYDENTESVSGSGVLIVTDSVLGVPDGSGDVSGEGEGTDTTATTVVVVPTVISPTPSSGVWCSESLVSSSASGNGSAVSSGA
ncbi:uncharacterized protein, partial [Littorina saxatilis]|uniref:uncharacterized protein n=1 Tax=Littorina saxatilis TaxID=31220 RepID=UPI0038B529AE